MKFGHDLAKVIGVSDPEWAPFFIRYKLLKKYIKEIPVTNSKDIKENEHLNKEQSAQLAQSKPEIAFFRVLRAELDKSSRFFKTAEQVLEIRRERIAEALRQLQQAVSTQDLPHETKSVVYPDAGEKALSACVAYYRDLLLLENYAIINYCGFSKILKKHDKRTGYQTRAQFMRVCVAPESFSHYPHLLEMIKEAENLYHDLNKATIHVSDQEKHAVFFPAAEAAGVFSEHRPQPQAIPLSSDQNSNLDDESRQQQQHPSTHHETSTTSSPLAAAAMAVNTIKKEVTTSPGSHHRSLRGLGSIRREESDFIDAILNLRSEATRLREVEDSLPEEDNQTQIQPVTTQDIPQSATSLNGGLPTEPAIEHQAAKRQRLAATRALA